MSWHRFSAEEADFLREHQAGRSRKELAGLFNARFGGSLSVQQIKTACANRGLTNGRSGKFTKGNIPFNSGLKGWQAGGRARETQFRPGQRPVKYRPVGAERITSEGYTEVKVADRRKWRMKHAVIWEAAYGPVPAGHVVIFADGDKANVTLDNLVLVSRAQLAVMNKLGLLGGGRELAEAGRTVADITMKIAQRKKKMHGGMNV